MTLSGPCVIPADEVHEALDHLAAQVQENKEKKAVHQPHA